MTSVQRWNQTRARLSVRRESGAAMTCGDLMATVWRKAKTLLQSSAIVFNFLAAACLVLPGFAEFASLALMVMKLLSLLSLSDFLVVSTSFSHSVMERAKIFRSSPASDSPWRIAASVRNGGRRIELRGVQSLCFLEHAMLPVEVRRRTCAIGRRILSPSVAKAISIFWEITEDENRFPAWKKDTTDPPRD